MLLKMKLTKQASESVAAAFGVLAPKNLPTPAENVRAWWKKVRRVYPEATVRALDRRRVHRRLRRGRQKARHRPPIPRDHRLRASRRQDLEPERRPGRQIRSQGLLQ